MKIKRQHSVILLCLALSTVHGMSARVGCMDNSRHGYQHDPDCSRYPDYKDLHFVGCSCPCEQYPQRAWYGECSRCGHYRKPVEYT